MRTPISEANADEAVRAITRGKNDLSIADLPDATRSAKVSEGKLRAASRGAPCRSAFKPFGIHPAPAVSETLSPTGKFLSLRELLAAPALLVFRFQKPVILLVENDADDVVMIRHSLKKASVTLSLQVVRDGREALAYLNGEGKYAGPGFPIPALVLLDLNLPRMDGFEVLRWMRRQPHFDSMPVVVLTNSLDPGHAEKAYACGANSFLSKPADFQDAVRLMLLLVAQWLPAGFHRRNAPLAAAA